VYPIPVNKIPQSLTECFRSALNFWQSGSYVAEKGGLHHAVGLWILGIEEFGKYALLRETADGLPNSQDIMEIRELDFKNHSLKSEKGHALLKKWGIDLSLVDIPLTEKTREALWYVKWDESTQEFKRDFSTLEKGALLKVDSLKELMRLAIVRMRQLEQASRISVQ
jgi:AbiV family abortive infection protein